MSPLSPLKHYLTAVVFLLIHSNNNFSTSSNVCSICFVSTFTPLTTAASLISLFPFYNSITLIPDILPREQHGSEDMNLSPYLTCILCIHKSMHYNKTVSTLWPNVTDWIDVDTKFNYTLAHSTRNKGRLSYKCMGYFVLDLDSGKWVGKSHTQAHVIGTDDSELHDKWDDLQKLRQNSDENIAENRIVQKPRCDFT